MKPVLLILLGTILLNACCGGAANCDDDCKTVMVFSFDPNYSADDLDTIVNIYKKEGFRNPDTLYHILVNGRYTPNHACANDGQLGLHKNISDKDAKDARVQWYTLYVGADSFIIDDMDLTVARTGDRCESCITWVEKKFKVDGVLYKQNELVPTEVFLPMK